MEEIDKYINKINSLSKEDYDKSFNIASKCSKLLNKDKDLARIILIYILNNWSNIHINTKKIWIDLIETMGFYPYIKKNEFDMQLDSLSDKIRYNTFASHYIDDIYLHLEQKKMLKYLFSEKNLILSAPTSFGKSLLIEEIIASKKYKNIIIIQPTLALLDETRRKLKKYKTNYKIIVNTTQTPSSTKGNLFLLTAERVVEYEFFNNIDFLIIDEFYKFSNKRNDSRTDILNNAFIKIINTFNPKFYMLGPNIDGISNGFAEKYNAIFYKTNYSLVECNIIDMSKNIENKKNKELVLFDLLYSLHNEQTIIYCSSPEKVRELARNFYYYLNEKKYTKKTNLPIIEWINKKITPDWILSKELEFGIGIHSAAIYKHMSNSIINYFNEGKLNYIFCTSTIIEGVNTSAKNVIIYDNKRGRNTLDYFDYSNIKGRSGRLMQHYVGTLYNFISPPNREEIIVDIPFYEQNKNSISNEILINIPKKDIKKENKERYDKLYEYEIELINIIKKNGMNIQGQHAIYNTLMHDIKTNNKRNIIWKQLPDWNQKLYILNLAFKHLFKEKDNLTRSAKQLCYFLQLYEKNDIKSMINNFVKNISEKSNDNEVKILDTAIGYSFKIIREWFQYKVPKAFRVIDNLQNYVCLKNNIESGSYSLYIQKLEGNFIKENLTILLEYGIPWETVKAIEQLIPDNINEDEVVTYIQKNKKLLYKTLMEYEKDCLEYFI